MPAGPVEAAMHTAYNAEKKAQHQGEPHGSSEGGIHAYRGPMASGHPKTGDPRSKILVTGATGHVGSQLIRELTKFYREQFHITAAVYEGSPKVERSELWQGADRRLIMSADRPETLDFAGIEMMCLVPDSTRYRVRHVKAYMEAARRCGVLYVLLISGMHPSGDASAMEECADFTRHFPEMERVVANSGLAHTVLRCGFFQQNFFFNAEEISVKDTISLPIGQGRFAPLNVVDVGSCAAAILNHPGRHIGCTYTLVGPELLDQEGVAVAASNGLGRSIRVVDVEPSVYRNLLLDQGLDPWQADGMLDMMKQARENRLAGLFSKAFYEQQTGRQGIRLEAFFRTAASEFTRREPKVTATETTAAVPSKREVPVDTAKAREIPAQPFIAPRQPVEASKKQAQEPEKPRTEVTHPGKTVGRVSPPQQAVETRATPSKGATEAPPAIARTGETGERQITLSMFCKLFRIIEVLNANWSVYHHVGEQTEQGRREMDRLVEQLRQEINAMSTKGKEPARGTSQRTEEVTSKHLPSHSEPFQSAEKGTAAKEPQRGPISRVGEHEKERGITGTPPTEKREGYPQGESPSSTPFWGGSGQQEVEGAGGLKHHMPADELRASGISPTMHARPMHEEEHRKSGLFGRIGEKLGFSKEKSGHHETVVEAAPHGGATVWTGGAEGVERHSFAAERDVR